MIYTVRYTAGPYSGERIVFAEDPDQALRLVRSRIRRHMTCPMYSDTYRIVAVNEREG